MIWTTHHLHLSFLKFKTFDTIHFDILQYKLKLYGINIIPSSLIRRHSLSNIFQYVNYENCNWTLYWSWNLNSSRFYIGTTCIRDIYDHLSWSRMTWVHALKCEQSVVYDRIISICINTHIKVVSIICRTSHVRNQL